MSVLTRALAVAALCFCGCASTPSPAQRALVEQSIPPWPESVADTCPERRVSVECFRDSGLPKAAVNEGMANLFEKLHDCIRRDAVPVKVMLTIETRGGAPSCVDRSPRSGEAARCLANAVARHLVIPNSRPDEACSFRYPVWLQRAPTSGSSTSAR